MPTSIAWAMIATMAGRFAPSPTGPLHLGNLRTALVAWLAARSRRVGFVVRMEDLDRVTASPRHEAAQLADLGAIGLDWDGPVVRQSERFERYFAALDQLRQRDLLYPCYCTRREIRAEIAAAASAPHGMAADGAYPGRCRTLDRAARTRLEAAGRRPAWRLRAEAEEISFIDELAGPYAGRVDDVVLARNDGVPSYTVGVVVDDAAQGVSQVVRGDDLLSSTTRQIHLQRLLSLPTPSYLHVPLVLGPDGQRLAKRHGSVTLGQLTAGLDDAARAARIARVVGALVATLGQVDPPAPDAAPTGVDPMDRAAMAALASHFSVAAIPREPLAWPVLEAVLA